MKVFAPLYRIALTILLASLNLNALCGQNIRSYNAASGLSENSIKCIIQDKKGYIWFATQDGLNVFNGHSFKSYGCSYQPSQNKSVDALNILSILQHRDGKQIWVATQSAKIFQFNPETEQFKELDLSQSLNCTPNLCLCFAYDRKENLWIGTDSGIIVYNEDHDSFSCYTTQNSNLPDDLVGSICCDSKGIIWIGSGRGLSKFNPVTNNFTNIRNGSETVLKNSSRRIISIAEDPLGTLWIGTWNNGLAKLNKDNNTLTYLRPKGGIKFSETLRVRHILADNPTTLQLCTNIGLFEYNIAENHLKQVILSARQQTDNIYVCIKDKEGGTWIGTYFKGAYYISPKAKQIECYTPDNTPQYLHGSAISSFCEDDEGKIWIASENGGLSLFDPSIKQFIKTNYHIADDNLHSLCIYGKHLYIGTFAKGLRQIDLQTGRTRVFLKEHSRSINSNNIFSLFKGRDNVLYIGSDLGCTRYYPAKGVFSEIEELQGTFIYDIAEDMQDNLWFAGYYDGLYRYNKKSRTWQHYKHDPSDPHSLPHNKLLSLYLDDKQRLWICSEGGGVCTYDYKTDSFLKFDIHNGEKPIYLTIIYGVLNDAEGNLWFSSNHGIYCCDEQGYNSKHFTHEDGLQNDQYNFGATFRSSTGKLYFGGINGFNIISPENLQQSNFPPTVTACINYKTSKGVSVTTRSETDTDSIVIPRKIDSFSINFECLSYLSPGKNEFAYKFHKNDYWTHTKESSVTFIDFPYGKHSVRIKACNGDGHDSANEVVLHIDNRPPLLKSRTAKVCYVLLIMAALAAAMVAIDRRRNTRTKEKIRAIKIKQEQETYAAKINFFTHIAHEIKTPVSLITAPLEVVLKNQHSEENRRNLDIIEKNTKRLLNLVNQLLDFKKISSEGYELKMQLSDPRILVQSVINRFLGATIEGVTIDMDLPENLICCMLDTEAYIKIISNLMANALKHAKSKIRVSLSLLSNTDGQILHLCIQDDGEGIPASERSKIFDSFYQIDKKNNPRMTGVGLGLSLVKLLTEKHNGSAYVDQSYTDGCSMCIDIPYLMPSSLPDAETTFSESKTPLKIVSPAYARQRILVVEDADDMRDFISETFSHGYLTFKAENGEQALSLLRKHDVDIIISDISMPIMNGFDLLRAIRKDDMFCHIPFIMLTVECSLETKIKGLEYGADAYIEKPFSVKHLQATVHNLLASREALRKRFISEPLKSENESLATSRDHRWLDKAIGLICTNIHETELSISQLAADMNLSQSSFQRKIKGLTGLTPLEFIRLIRLKKAAELLTTGTYRVNEVCYLVGFNKPSYFSSHFKKQFGILPKDFALKNDPKMNGKDSMQSTSRKDTPIPFVP